MKQGSVGPRGKSTLLVLREKEVSTPGVRVNRYFYCQVKECVYVSVWLTRIKTFFFVASSEESYVEVWPLVYSTGFSPGRGTEIFFRYLLWKSYVEA